jgi:hypothetical protein
MFVMLDEQDIPPQIAETKHTADNILQVLQDQVQKSPLVDLELV